MTTMSASTLQASATAEAPLQAARAAASERTAQHRLTPIAFVDTTAVLVFATQELMERAAKAAQQLSAAAAGRTASLGVVLAAMPKVPTDEVAQLVGVSVDRLIKWVHGEEQIPKAKEPRFSQLAEILRNVHGVLKPEATGAWLKTPLKELDGFTPLEAINKGRVDKVVKASRKYLDTTFA